MFVREGIDIMSKKFLSVTADHLHPPWDSEMFRVLTFPWSGSAWDLYSTCKYSFSLFVSDDWRSVSLMLKVLVPL